MLVFEDLHWIDSEMQALLDSLVESLPTAHLLLLVNYRPEYQHGWGRKTCYLQLRLDPLPVASADELLQALLGDDPSLAPLKRLLIVRTDGNPFFLEESVRTLVETQGLDGDQLVNGCSRPASLAIGSVSNSRKTGGNSSLLDVRVGRRSVACRWRPIASNWSARSTVVIRCPSLILSAFRSRQGRPPLDRVLAG